MKVLVSMMKKQTPDKKAKITLKFECEKLAPYVDVSGTPEQVMQCVMDLLKRYVYPLSMTENSAVQKDAIQEQKEVQREAAAG